MKINYLYILGIIFFFISCSSSNEPHSFLDIKFGTTYEKAKKHMLAKGYKLHIEDPNQKRISFTGTYEGFSTEMILLEMDENHTLKEGWLNVVEDTERFISFIKDKLTKKYQQPSTSLVNEKGEIWKWEFTSYNIILGLTNELAYYRIVKNNN